MQYSELHNLNIQSHFADEISKLRQLVTSRTGINVPPNPLWIGAVRAMFNRDCTSRSTSEFLIQSYSPKDRNGRQLEGKLNIEVVTLLIVSALINPKKEQKILFCAESLSTFTACDIATVIRKNFCDYELVATFNSAPMQKTVFRLIARK